MTGRCFYPILEVLSAVLAMDKDYLTVYMLCCFDEPRQFGRSHISALLHSFLVKCVVMILETVTSWMHLLI